MKFHVNDACIGCGLCAGTCPEVFHLTDAGVAQAADQETDSAVLDAARSAMTDCPVSAIEEA